MPVESHLQQAAAAHVVLNEVAPDSPELRAALEGADLPTEDITEAGRSFFRLDADGQTIGFGGYEVHNGSALLRSVVVLPQHRGKGFGRVIAEAVLARAAKAGAHQAYLLTTTAEVFFERAGFTRIDRSSAPAEILATRQAATICSTAALLTRPIDV